MMIGGKHPQLLGNENMTSAPSGTFKTKDGYINIAANKQEQWELLADILGLEELREDPRFKLRDSRKKNRYELNDYVNAKLIEKNTDEWVEILNNAGIPSGAILTLEQALNQPQIIHRNTFADLDTPEIGKVKVFNMTAKFEKTPGIAEKAPPLLSEHTKEILNQFGYSDDEIVEMKRENVI